MNYDFGQIVSLHERMSNLSQAMRQVRIAEVGAHDYGRRFENEGVAIEGMARLNSPLATIHNQIVIQYEDSRTQLHQLVMHYFETCGEKETARMLWKLKRWSHPLGHACYHEILNVLDLKNESDICRRLYDLIECRNPYITLVA